MKRLFTTAAVALALFTSTAAADYFRVFYYVEGKNNPCSAEHFRPFKYSTVAKNAAEAYRELIETEPAAVYVTINNLGKEK